MSSSGIPASTSPKRHQVLSAAANMDRLPQDIYDEIGALLQDSAFDKPALATISRQWQTAIERQTFKKIHLRSTDLHRFQAIIRDHRRGYVNTVEYIIILPGYADEERCRFEREETRQANDEGFTAAIHQLFNILKSWDIYKDGFMELQLCDVYSVADHAFLCRSSPLYDLSTYQRLRKDGENRTIDLWSWRFQYSYLRLLYFSELPTIPVIRSFQTSSTTRHICDRTAIDMAARLPNLNVARWMMNDWEIPYITLRRTHRQDLARAIAQLPPRSTALQDLTIHMLSSFFWAPKFSGGALDQSDSSMDALSDAIRVTTGQMERLKNLYITGTVDESLFCPSPVHPLREPYWQNLEHLKVIFSARRPCGGCYFLDSRQPNSQLSQTAMIMPSETEVPLGYGDNEREEDEAAIELSLRDHVGNLGFVDKVLPDEDSLVPLMEAFGRACAQMPMLKSAILYSFIPVSIQLNSGRRWQDRSRWGVWYLSPKISLVANKSGLDPAFSEDINQRRLFWDVMSWRPSMELQNLFQELGRDSYGTTLIERFVDSWNTVGKQRSLRRYNST